MDLCDANFAMELCCCRLLTMMQTRLGRCCENVWAGYPQPLGGVQAFEFGPELTCCQHQTSSGNACSAVIGWRKMCAAEGRVSAFRRSVGAVFQLQHMTRCHSASRLDFLTWSRRPRSPPAHLRSRTFLHSTRNLPARARSHGCHVTRWEDRSAKRGGTLCQGVAPVPAHRPHVTHLLPLLPLMESTTPGAPPAPRSLYNHTILYSI